MGAVEAVVTVICCIIVVAGFVAWKYVNYMENKVDQEARTARQELETKQALGEAALRNEVIKSRIADIRINHNRYNPYKCYGDDAQTQLYTVFVDGFEKGQEAMREKAKEIVQYTERT
jgi:hypothetical protein